MPRGAAPHLAPALLVGLTLSDGKHAPAVQDSPFSAMPRSLLPSAQSPHSRTSPLPVSPAGQPQLTQRAVVQLFPCQLPLQVGAEEQERVLVPLFPQLARKMGQSGKVQGVGKGTRSRAPSLPYSKENKVTRSFPSNQGILRGPREGGRGRKEGQSGERPAQKIRKKDLTPTQEPRQLAGPPRLDTHTQEV